MYPYQGRYLTYLGKVSSYRSSLMRKVTEYIAAYSLGTRQSGKRCANPFIFLNILGH